MNKNQIEVLDLISDLRGLYECNSWKMPYLKWPFPKKLSDKQLSFLKDFCAFDLEECLYPYRLDETSIYETFGEAFDTDDKDFFKEINSSSRNMGFDWFLYFFGREIKRISDDLQHFPVLLTIQRCMESFGWRHCMRDILNSNSNPTDERPAAQEPPAKRRELPCELDTKKAKIYFERAVKAGLMSEQYEWKKSKALLACFCREMSLNLGLGKGQTSDGKKRLCWKPFERLFGIKKLAAALADIQKTGQDPIGIEEVNKIFKG